MNTILRKQFLAHVGQTSPEPMMIEVARAEGVFFYTPEGKHYYDLVAGVSVSNVGHANPRVVEAVQRQAADYMHIMVYGEMIERPQVRYAARIAELLPGELSSVYFVNSGAEAIEGALKLAKRYTHRTELVSMRRAYHGSTQGAMSLMGEPEGEEWKGAFRPLLPDVRAIDFNDFDQLRLITRRTACVVVEPVQGEAGVYPWDPDTLYDVAQFCRKNGLLLIVDEVQSGIFRCGEFPFAFQNLGITPDIITMAKGIASGFPMGACAARIEVAEAFEPGDHGSTFGGSNLAMAAAHATLATLSRGHYDDRVTEVGDYFAEKLAQVEGVTEVRGMGLMLGADLEEGVDAHKVVAQGLEEGFLLNATGEHTLRFLPPLIATENEIDKLIDALPGMIAAVRE